MSLAILSEAPTSPPPRRDGSTVVFEVQSAGCVEHRVHEDVRLTLLQHVQHLLQQRKEEQGAIKDEVLQLIYLDLMMNHTNEI